MGNGYLEKVKAPWLGNKSSIAVSYGHMKRYLLKLVAMTAAMVVTTASAQDYSSYGGLLKKYVRAGGVDYAGWAASAPDQAALDAVLADWARVDARKLGKADRAAFRINLYNAAMLDVVLDRYPLKSVTKIGLPFSIFKKRIIATPSGKISFDTLEKKQLLGDYPDARVHFAVNCASVSCPPLAVRPYVGKTLDHQLTAAARHFANSRHAVRVEGGTAYYSELFKWYADDFGTDDPSVYLNKYRTDKLPSGLKVKYQDYDWGLNAA